MDGHVQHAAGLLLVVEAGVSQRFNDHEDDVCPLRRPEVLSKVLQGGRDVRHVTPSALMVLQN